MDEIEGLVKEPKVSVQLSVGTAGLISAQLEIVQAPQQTSPQPAMTAEEAVRAAAREGLDLLRSDNQSGFVGVFLAGRSRDAP